MNTNTRCTRLTDSYTLEFELAPIASPIHELRSPGNHRFPRLFSARARDLPSAYRDRARSIVEQFSGCFAALEGKETRRLFRGKKVEGA